MFYTAELHYKEVLKLLEFHIETNKITCIVGESGGGKTTLLRLLSKLISPTEGTLYFKDEEVEKIDSVEYRKKVILLPQKPYVFPGTIKDNLVKGLMYHKKKVLEDELASALKFVHLNKPLDTKSKFLSGGESQRLAIARIILLDPEVILLDEPSSALDEETEQFVIKAMCEYVKSNNKTLVMVTHSKAIAKQYGDTILTIENGELKGRLDNGR